MWPLFLHSLKKFSRDVHGVTLVNRVFIGCTLDYGGAFCVEAITCVAFNDDFLQCMLLAYSARWVSSTMISGASSLTRTKNPPVVRCDGTFKHDLAALEFFFDDIRGRAVREFPFGLHWAHRDFLLLFSKALAMFHRPCRICTIVFLLLSSLSSKSNTAIIEKKLIHFHNVLIGCTPDGSCFFFVFYLP